jgi:parvulin-like peptidyl-prolyl isomerase
MTTPIRVTIALLVAALVLLASACGGGQSVPSGAIAVVDGSAITRSELDQWIGLTKKNYEARKQEFPKVGSSDYQSIRTRFVAVLVQQLEWGQAAADLGVKVSEKDIDKGVQDEIKNKFGGKRANLEKALKQQQFPEELYRKIVRFSVLSQKIFDAVTKDVEVTDSDIRAYYTTNISSYQTPESRDVRHILIAEKGADGQVDYAKSKTEANRIFDQLRNGADFVSLAKQYSADEQSKDSGGKLTISRGQTVPEFDKKAFELKTGAISEPVKTSYGYHLIQALTNVKPAKTTPYDQVKESIRQSLLQTKRQDVMAKWADDLTNRYKSKVSYATGFAPPDIPTTPTETATQ